MAKIRALIFDYDGLLVNTQEALNNAHEQMVGMHGKKLEKEDAGYMMGRRGKVNMQYLKDKYQLPETPEELLKMRRQITKKIFENQLSLMEGVPELLEWARKAGIVCAVGTGTTRELLEWGLGKTGISGYFKVCVTIDDIKGSGKPEPEVFLLAAEELGVKPEECVVIGDAPNDVLAAKAAGMKSIYVPDARYVDPINNHKADVILRSLKEVTAEIIDTI